MYKRITHGICLFDVFVKSEGYTLLSKILSPLFTAVEEFCPFPEFREEGDTDEVKHNLGVQSEMECSYF